MESYTPAELPAGPVVRLTRWIAPWIALGAIVWVVVSLSTGFKSTGGSPRDASVVATATAGEGGGAIVVTAAVPTLPPKVPTTTTTVKPATTTTTLAGPTTTAPPKTGRTVAVTLVPGVRLRTWALAGSDVVADLSQGTELEVLGQKGDWYQVKDSRGDTGWVKADPDVIRVEKR